MATAEPAIAVLPYGQRLGTSVAQVSLDDLAWPLGRPERLDSGTVCDLAASDHLIVYPRTSMHFQLHHGTAARLSVVLGEPSVIHARHLALLRLTYRRFFRVLTFNETLLSRIPNGIFFPLGTTWVPEWRSLNTAKSRMCSLIASAKRDSEGHKLRHASVDWIRRQDRDVDVLGRGYIPFDAKADGLAPYRYSVVIENVRERNYFSEKLVDAVLCDTVPIYWGCPNLDRFMAPDGIIQCASEADIRQAVERMSVEDYDRRRPAIEALKPVVASFCDLEARAARAIRDALGGMSGEA